MMFECLEVRPCVIVRLGDKNQVRNFATHTEYMAWKAEHGKEADFWMLYARCCGEDALPAVAIGNFKSEKAALDVLHGFTNFLAFLRDKLSPVTKHTHCRKDVIEGATDAYWAIDFFINQCSNEDRI